MSSTAAAAVTDQLSDRLDRLENGIDLAVTLLQTEADAGRTAVTQYRQLDAAITRATTALADGAVTLTQRAAAAGEQVVDGKPAAGFWSSPVRVVVAGVVAVGAVWGVLKLLEKEKTGAGRG
jgi:hypothetical protein